jgi:hypothetical protein
VAFSEVGNELADSVYIDHLNIRHIGDYQGGQNTAGIFCATTTIPQDSYFSHGSRIRACNIDWVTHLSGEVIHQYAIGVYAFRQAAIESCYTGPHCATGILLKASSYVDIADSAVTLRHNFIDRARYSGIEIYLLTSDIWAYGNTIVGHSTEGVSVRLFAWTEPGGFHDGYSYFYNNTFYNCHTAFYAQNTEYGSVYEISDRRFKYNIIYDGLPATNTAITINGNDPSWTVIDSNMYYLTGYNFTESPTSGNFATWQGLGWDAHGVFGIDPGFTNALGGDFSRLSSGQEINQTYGGRTWTRFGGWQPPSGPDITPPVISNVRATDTTSVSVTIRWSTNEGATSRVEYGLTTSYGLFTILDPLLLWTHAQILPALSPSTVYHYRVYSRDAAGNQTISPDFTFRTLTPDLVAPAISGVGAHDITPSSATISWITDEAATSQVNYGTTSAYGSTTTLDPTPVLTHGVGLSSLTPNTLYHYRVRSQDAAGNEAVSGDFTFRSDTVWTMQLLSVGVPVTVSGTYAGYNPAVINDGVIDPRGGTSTTWASDADTANPHWIELTLSGSYRVGRARIYWAWNGSSSNWMCSQQYIIQYWDAGAGAFVNATVVNNSSADSVTLTDFPPVTTNRIRYWQPANMGPATYRRILWLTEFQLYGNLSGQDTIPPNRINDFQAEPGELEGGVGLQWTAPGSGDGTSVADRYDIRYSTSPIDESTWLQATVVADPPAPNAQGVAETFAATGLSPGIIYNFAIKSSDGAGNESPISNVVSSYSAGISPPMALETRVNSSTATAVLVGASVNSYLSVFYEFALDTTLAFASPRTDVSLLADSTVTCFFDSLSIDGYYYWRFRAAATDGSFTSAWSNVLGFDYNSGIGPALTNADCIFPTEGTTVQSSTPTFLVRLVPDVAHVYIQVASDISFSSPIESGPLAVTDGDIEWEASQPLQQGATYYWRASADNFIWTTPISFSAEVDIHPYPNPFRASENAGGVTFVNLPQNSRLTVATVSGSIVREVEGIGPDEWTWDVKNSGGGDLASGVYLYRVDFRDGSSSGKLMVIR